MPLNAVRLAGNVLARMTLAYRNEAPADKAQDPDYWLGATIAIWAEEIIAEITTHARCSGTDSNGDSHNNVGIV